VPLYCLAMGRYLLIIPLVFLVFCAAWVSPGFDPPPYSPKPCVAIHETRHFDVERREWRCSEEWAFTLGQFGFEGV
jgi:hypothetical protein